MQLLLLHFAGNRRVLNLHKGVQQAAKEKKTKETSPLDDVNHDHHVNQLRSRKISL